MRDLLMFAVVFAGLPFILRRPWIGVMFWVWLSVMNPHRLSWGIAYGFPFAMLVALTTLIGVLLTKDPRELKGGAAAAALFAFVAFACVTTLFALVPSQATPMLERVLKIQILTFVALLVLHKREHVIWMVWMIVLSIGYYAVKGGVFTLVTLGAYRVWGPAESFITDNNALALSTVMTIPLWAYLFIYYRGRSLRWLFIAAIALSAVSALGSYSRGALLAIAAMALFLWVKGRHKVLLGAALVVAGIGLVAFMPDMWQDRMQTISEYKEDESAQGRIETWHMLFDIAVDRPLTGGGFEPYSIEVLQRYRPEYQTVRAAHSIYFQVLGEHGFIGLALFLGFWALTWSIARRIERDTKNVEEDQWAFWLARMIQVSLVAYFVGGTFLNLAYWDVPYYLMVILAVTAHLVSARKGGTDRSTVGSSPALHSDTAAALPSPVPAAAPQRDA